MKISSDQIREELKDIWSKLEFIVLTDMQWIEPSPQEFNKFMLQWEDIKLPYIPDLHACEEFAIELMGFCRRERTLQALDGRIDSKNRMNWSLGIIGGTRFQAENINHWCNIVRRTDGWRLIEPQNNRTWIPNNIDDEVYFLLM